LILLPHLLSRRTLHHPTGGSGCSLFSSPTGVGRYFIYRPHQGRSDPCSTSEISTQLSTAHSDAATPSARSPEVTAVWDFATDVTSPSVKDQVSPGTGRRGVGTVRHGGAGARTRKQSLNLKVKPLLRLPVVRSQSAVRGDDQRGGGPQLDGLRWERLIERRRGKAHSSSCLISPPRRPQFKETRGWDPRPVATPARGSGLDCQPKASCPATPAGAP
jgi:hypothetical protein